MISDKSSSKRKFDFLFYYFSVTENVKLYKKIYSQYKQTGAEKSILFLKDLYFHIASGDADFVINTISKDNQIIPKYKDTKDASFYLGLAFLIKNEFQFAKNAFLASSEIKPSTYLSYLITVCDARTILSKGSVFLISDEEKELLKEYYNRVNLPETEKFFAERDTFLRSDYYLNKLSILLIYDPSKALEEHTLLPDEIKRQTIIKIIYADILTLKKDYDKALEILTEISNKHKNPNIFTKIINLLMIKKSPKKIIEFTDSLTKNDFDEDGNIAGIFIEALYQTSGIKIAQLKADQFLKQHGDPFLIYYSLGKIYFSEGDKDEGKKWLTKCSEKIKKENDPFRYIIAEDCLYYDLPSLATKILKPLIPYELKAKIRFLEVSLKSDDEKVVQESIKILDSELQESPSDMVFLKLKADIEYHRGNKRESLEILDRIFDMQQMPDVAYNIVSLKSELNIQNFSKYSKILEKESDARYLMLAAYCYFLDGDYEKSQNLGYFALSKNGNTFDEIIFSQYMQIILIPSLSTVEKVEFERIEVNTSFELANDNKTIWITIDSNKTLFEEGEKLEFSGSIHLLHSNEDSLFFINHKKRDIVEYQNENFTINQIISNKTQVFRFCLSEYTKNVPNSNFMQQIIISKDDPLSSILPFLVEQDRAKDEIFKDYNLRNKVGVPLNMMSKFLGPNLLDTMLQIFAKKDQPFYSGEVNLIIIENVKCVLSCSSIFILKILDRLDNLLKFKEYIFVSEATKHYFQSLIQDIDKFERNTKLTIGIHENNPIINEITEYDISKRRKFFLEILTTINQFQRSKANLKSKEYDSEDKLISVIGLNEFENIKLSIQINGVYISEDLVARKYNNMTRETKSSTNVVALLLNIHGDNIFGLLDDLIKLAKTDYLFTFNYSLLVDLIIAITDKFKIVGPNTAYDLLGELISSSLKSRICFDNNELILLETINILYNHRFRDNIDHCINIIINKLKLYYQAHGVEHVILFGKIRAMARTDEIKFAYFKKSLN